MRLLRKWTLLAHRYLGIALGAVFITWFASGLVMMYAGGMPQLSPDLRRERLPELNTSQVRVSAQDAADRAGVDDPERMTLTTVLGRPAYRIGGRTIFADTGESLGAIDRRTARDVAASFLGAPAASLEFVGTVEQPDQWTLTLWRSLPFFKFRTREATEVYVSARTADVAVATTTRDRLLAWLGVIPHWLYVAPLRLNQPLWYAVVVSLSIAGCVAAALGLAAGLVRLRRTAPLRWTIPYTGWMRWHVITGAVFGVFTLTWVFSGLISMEPFAWTNARGLELDPAVFTGGPLEPARFPLADPAAWRRIAGSQQVKEIELTRLHDEPYFVAHLGHAARAVRRERLHQPYPVAGQTERARVLVHASSMTVKDAPWSPQALVARMQAAAPGLRVVEQTLLSDYDDYYYSRRGLTPLPVLRVKFDDPMETWVYVDPTMSRVLAQIHRLNRVERWVYNGLHSLDFAFWYRTWFWDVGVIVLCLGGLLASTIGTVLGYGRLLRGARPAPGVTEHPTTALSGRHIFGLSSRLWHR